MYERNGHTEECSEDCAHCRYGNLCENYSEPLEEKKKDKKTEVNKEQVSQPSMFDLIDKKEQEINEINSFVVKKLNSIVNGYYKLGYDVRRLYKYGYLDSDRTALYDLINSQDNFYLFGNLSPINISEKYENLPAEKKDRIERFADLVDIFKISDLLNMYYRDDDGCLFSVASVASINPAVKAKKENGKKTYYVDEKYLNKYLKDLPKNPKAIRYAKEQMEEDNSSNI